MRFSCFRPVNKGRRRFMRGVGYGAGAVLLAGGELATAATEDKSSQKKAEPKNWPWSKSVAADPTDIPAPIIRDHAVHHEIELTAREVEGKLDSGTTFMYMTWDGQVPGPMLRVRQDDTVTLAVTSDPNNQMLHNIDLHAVYGPGGGAADTLIVPGQSRSIRFKCLYPGAFIYHCAVPNMDEHISRGMFGMIVVEPREGLPKVDREFYLAQHEIYTKESFGTKGELTLSYDAMAREQPEYVVFSGAVNGFTAGRLGPMQARVGETVRVFLVSGGPNLMSSFHPIGNVWKRCWPQGAWANPPLNYVQTQSALPGSCFVGDLELPVPATIKLVDHAMSRVERKGLLAEIEVKGGADPAIYTKIDEL